MEGASARTTLSLGGGRCECGSADPLWGGKGLVNLLERVQIISGTEYRR